MSRRPRKNFRARCEQLEDRGLLSMLTPAQVRQAYGMNTIEFSANGQTIPGTGAGQTIAIVGAFHNPFVTDELYAFNAAYGLFNPALVQVNLAGAQTNIGWAEEEAARCRMEPRDGAESLDHRRRGRLSRYERPDERGEPRPQAARRLGRVDELGRQRVPGPDHL